jgi:uncharacterized flavoprotein (TIGR03862 family)
MTHSVAIVGGGPAGLMAAEVLAHAGVAVHLFDAMPSVGRKFLLAGKGGLNLTHSEPAAAFYARFGARQAQVQAWLEGFGAGPLRRWAQGLGIETFVGSSGRVFPVDMKAAPLLRAWLHRLRHPASGTPVAFHMRHRWVGWDAASNGGAPGLRFKTPDGARSVAADAVVLALGGASWPRLGSDGTWVDLLRARGVPVAPLLPSNCGFDVAGGWSALFAQRFAGQPLKSVCLYVPAAGAGPAFRRKGEFVATATGIEGSLVYAASARLRDSIAAQGRAELFVDLLPDFTPERVLQHVAHPRGARSLSSHLKGRLGIAGIKAGLLFEVLGRDQWADAALVARTLKALPLRLCAPRPVAEAISSAGGVAFEGLDARLMLRQCPAVFCAGEMLDWEAPTGGYLLTAAMASGRFAAGGVLRHLGLAD